MTVKKKESPAAPSSFHTAHKARWREKYSHCGRIPATQNSFHNP